MSKKHKKSIPTTQPKSKSKTNVISFTISVDPFNCRKFTTSEIGRGVYIGKSKKGKGSYNRKAKHKTSYDSFLFFNTRLILIG
ncbi:hypothetical protein [Clostridium sp.]|uniref:hypothetical protein n=1 Tax=Clostridium sp. TaxID=1506 RepID=UPI00260B7091|nr:hypothetical protein [Clostridium sp.]